MRKRSIVLSILLLGLISVYAEKQKIPIKEIPKKDPLGQVWRSPRFIPVEVTYDTDTHIVEVTCSTDLAGEVYIYEAAGIEEAYSPCLNTVLSVGDSQYHTIIIEGDGWEATGVIE